MSTVVEGEPARDLPRSRSGHKIISSDLDRVEVLKVHEGTEMRSGHGEGGEVGESTKGSRFQSSFRGMPVNIIDILSVHLGSP